MCAKSKGKEIEPCGSLSLKFAHMLRVSRMKSLILGAGRDLPVLRFCSMAIPEKRIRSIPANVSGDVVVFSTETFFANIRFKNARPSVGSNVEVGRMAVDAKRSKGHGNKIDCAPSLCGERHQVPLCRGWRRATGGPSAWLS